MADDVEQLRIRLAEAEAVIEALRGEQVDSAVAERSVALLRLSEVERDLRETERRFRALVESMPQFVWETDAEGQATYASHSWQEYTGLSLEDARGKGWTQAYHPDDLPRQLKAWEEALRTGKPYRVESRMRRAADGTYRWFIVRGSPVRAADGRITGWVGTCGDIDDRKRVEEALEAHRKSLERERNLLQTVMDGAENMHLAYLDRDFNFIRVNATYARTCGYRPEDMIGRNHFDLYPHEENEAIFARVRDTGEPVTYHDKPFEFPDNPDRGVTYWDWTLKPVQGAGGRVECLIFALVETTERKQAEDALRQVAQFPEENPSPVLRVASDGALLYANESARLLLADCWGWRAGDAVPDEVASLVADALGRSGATEGEFAVRDGRVFWFAAVCPADEDYVNLYGRDVTSRARANEDLRAAKRDADDARRRLEAVLEALPVGMSITDTRGGVVRANAAFEAVWGGPPPETSSVDDYVAYKAWWSETGRPVQAEEWASAQAVKTGRAVLGQMLEIQGFDGRRRFVLNSAAPIRDAEGAVIGAAVAVQDITMLHQAEMVLRQSRDELEARVRERTAELERRSVQLARLASELTLAEQRERRRIAEVLHDHLQQLLFAASMHTDILRESKGEDHREMLDAIYNIIGDAIDASRSLSRELNPPVLRQEGLMEALEWLADWMRDKHHLKVKLTSAGDMEVPREDVRVLLFQSIRELLFNVVKHADVDRASLSVRRGEEGELTITIRDRGAGFDLGVLTGKDAGSVGVGLFSIGERLNLLGGRLDIDSRPGCGSRFTLTVPAESLEGLAAGTSGESEPGERQRSRPRSHKARASTLCDKHIRVLLVDDHVTVRQGLRSLLERQPDVEVVGEASNGQEAVDLARKLHPDVILMDAAMPVMDGPEATRRIHAEMPEVRIIGLSMHQWTDLADAMRKAGACAYLTKSGESAVLLSAIRGQA